MAAPARQAAVGQVIHITERGQRIAAIVPQSMVEALLAAEVAPGDLVACRLLAGGF